MGKIFVACHHSLHLDLNHYLSGLKSCRQKWLVRFLWSAAVSGFKQLSFISWPTDYSRGGSVPVGFLLVTFPDFDEGHKIGSLNWKVHMIFQFQNKEVFCVFLFCFGSVSIFMIFHLLQVAVFGSFFSVKVDDKTWMLRLQVLVGSLVVPHGCFCWMKEVSTRRAFSRKQQVLTLR